MDTPRTRWSLYYSFRISSQIQYKYTPDTMVILLLIQTTTIRYRLDTLKTRTPLFRSYKLSLHIQFKCIPDTDTIMMLILLTYNIAIQQTFLDGIFKPISSKILPSPNGIFKPIPSTIFWRVQIYGHSSVQSSFTFESRKANLPI